jgi:hypothetical protein
MLGFFFGWCLSTPLLSSHQRSFIMRISALLSTAGLLSPVSAYSQETAVFHSGNQLYEDCIAQERPIQSYMEGAMLGAPSF